MGHSAKEIRQDDPLITQSDLPLPSGADRFVAKKSDCDDESSWSTDEPGALAKHSTGCLGNSLAIITRKAPENSL